MRTDIPNLKLAMAFVALGSNLGDSRRALLGALERLQEFSTVPLACSSFYQTTPVDCPPGSPVFLNAVAGLLPRPEETPESLLARLQSVEKDFGRAPKKFLNEARPLDLDLLTFGRQMRHSTDFVLPHPRAAQRRFVLQPLSEIAPELIFPGQQKTVAELLAALPVDSQVTRLS